MSSSWRGSGISSRVALIVSLASLFVSDASAIGVNLGQVADNLPTPAAIVQLVKSTTISKVKLFDANPAILTAFANSGIDIVIGAGNDQISPLATTPGYAVQWVQANIAAYPNTSIVAVAIGNEVLAYDASDAGNLLGAFKNVHSAAASLGLDVKVSTPNSLGILGSSDPPSSGVFHAWEASILTPIFSFLAETGSPLMINPYPYFSYAQANGHGNFTLDYCIFQANASEVKVDNGTGFVYTNMFDAQIDAVYSAIAKTGYKNVSVAVSETGWPAAGDLYEFGPSLADAQAYNRNLIKHVDSGVGTPLKPGVVIDTYIFDLFNEDLKTGPSSERNFGLYYANGTPVYDVGIIVSSKPAPLPSPASAPVPTLPPLLPPSSASLPPSPPPTTPSILDPPSPSSTPISSPPFSPPVGPPSPSPASPMSSPSSLSSPPDLPLTGLPPQSAPASTPSPGSGHRSSATPLVQTLFVILLSCTMMRL